MKNQIKSVISLTLICSVIAVLLAVTNAITAPKIKEQEAATVNKALMEVLPEGKDFEQITELKDMPETIKEVYKETSGKGFVIKLVTSGYGNGLTIMCGVGSDGAVKGAVCIASNETLGKEKTYGESFKNKSFEEVESVDTIAGATVTTSAYKNAVKDAINAAAVLGGGTAQKSEEEILKENLSIALPQAEGKFTVAFLTDEIKGFDAIYKADNDTGFVFVKGETFIATDNNGKLFSAEENPLNSKAQKAAKLIKNSELTNIDISKYSDMPAQIQKAFKTNSGNYVFEVRAAGYGINGDQYTRSNEFIYIKVSVTNKGQIISCVTLSQKESENIGDVCAKPEYYTQFNGKTSADIESVDTVAGATITTEGYRLAVSTVFEAAKILEGGAE